MACPNCGAMVPFLVRMSTGEDVCCAACAFHPFGCRCQFGEYGVPETYQDDCEVPETHTTT